MCFYLEKELYGERADLCVYDNVAARQGVSLQPDDLVKMNWL